MSAMSFVEAVEDAEHALTSLKYCAPEDRAAWVKIVLQRVEDLEVRLAHGHINELLQSQGGRHGGSSSVPEV